MIVEEPVVTASLEVKEVYRQLERCPFQSQTVFGNPATESKLRMFLLPAIIKEPYRHQREVLQ